MKRENHLLFTSGFGLHHCSVGCRKGFVLRFKGFFCVLSQVVSCFSKIQICFTFLVPAHPGSPGKRAVKRVCVCVSQVEHLCTDFYSVLLGYFYYTHLIASFAGQPG